MLVAEEDMPPLNEDTKSSVSLEYYHESTGLVLTPSTKEEARLPLNDPNSTHVAISFFPKNKREIDAIWQLEKQGAELSYIPFGYMIKRNSNDSDIRLLDKIEDYKLICQEESDYERLFLNDYDGFAPLGRSDTKLRKGNSCFYELYAICPVDIIIPEGLDYEKQFCINRGHDVPFVPIGYNIQLETYDSLLEGYVPLRNVKIALSYQGLTSYRFSNECGVVNLDPAFYNQPISEIKQTQVTCILSTQDWTITRDDSMTPIHLYLGTIQQIWNNAGVLPFGNDLLPVRISSTTTELEIHRAVDYYFNSNHEISNFISQNESGTIIHAMSSTHPEGWLGCTWASISRINIYNVGNPNCKTISTVLHELGHIHHYCFDNYNYYNLCEDIVLESYASYVGWYVGELYYLSKGYVRPYYGAQINQQGRQYWTNSSGSNYSPFFVDLIDDFNQSYEGLSYINDTISGVPISFVENMIPLCNSLSSCHNYLNNNVGVYFTLNDLNLMYSYYE